MDAFYASVEQRDVESLRGKPVVVGGQPDSRGVVAACSYEARRYGIRSAMPCAQAYRLCPEAVFVKPRFDVYREVSTSVRNIFACYTELIEPVSLDEAYLDVSDIGFKDSALSDGSATTIANDIRRRIFEELQLTASAGISYNKFLAKIASDMNKPNGFYVIRPEEASAFIGRLPVGRINGVGTVTEKKMHANGIYLGADLRRQSLEKLSQLFGKSGRHFFDIARGRDDRAVKSERRRKSLGAERTLAEDLVDIEQIKKRLMELAEKLEKTMRARNLKAKTITLKFKYADFTQITRAKTLQTYTNSLTALESTYDDLLTKTEVGESPIRLLGLSVSSFEPRAGEATERVMQSEKSQLGLF